MVPYTPESRPLLLNVKYIFERTPYLYTVLHVPGEERISRMEAHDILDFRSQSLRNYEIYFRFRLREISITRIQPFCIFSSVPIRPKVVTRVIWGHRSYRVVFLPSDQPDRIRTYSRLVSPKAARESNY